MVPCSAVLVPLASRDIAYFCWITANSPLSNCAFSRVDLGLIVTANAKKMIVGDREYCDGHLAVGLQDRKKPSRSRPGNLVVGVDTVLRQVARGTHGALACCPEGRASSWESLR